MSMDAINKFYDALDRNAALQAHVDEIRLRHAKAAFLEFQQFAARNGFEFSAEEFRSFREELEVAGWVNTYAARFKEYEIDDAFCGVSGKVRLLRILDTDGENLKNKIEDKEWKREEV